jgi:hypothetical protein
MRQDPNGTIGSVTDLPLNFVANYFVQSLTMVAKMILAAK